MNHLTFDKLEKFNSAQQAAFLVDTLKQLPISIVKFMSTVCNDLTTRNSSRYDSEGSLESTQFSNVMEEQANDIGFAYFFNFFI